MDITQPQLLGISDHLKFFHQARQAWYQLLKEFTVGDANDARASLARLTWIEEGALVSRYLTTVVAEQLLDAWGSFGEQWRSRYPGNLVAIPLYNRHRLSQAQASVENLSKADNSSSTPIAFAKAYPTWPRLFTQGMVCMWLLTGYGPLGSLCRLDYPGRKGYPVLMTAYAGETVLSAGLQANTSSAMREYESTLNPYYFTLKVLETILLNHHTDEPNNVSFELMSDASHSNACRLLSFDSEKKFVNPIVKWHKQHLQLKVVTVVYAMAPMKQPPDLNALKAFVSMDANTLLQQWLTELQSQYNDPFPCDRNRQGPYLFSKREAYALFTRKPSRSYLPNLFCPGMLAEFYRTMRQLQSVICERLEQGEPFADHFALVKVYQPRVAAVYQEAFDKATDSVTRHKAFQQLDIKYTPMLDNKTECTPLHYKQYAFGAPPIVSRHSKDSIRYAVRFGNHGVSKGLKEVADIHKQWESLENTGRFLQGERLPELQQVDAFASLIDELVKVHKQSSHAATSLWRLFQCLGLKKLALRMLDNRQYKFALCEATVLLDDVMRMQVMNAIDYTCLADKPAFSAQARWEQLVRLLLLGRYKHLKIRNNPYISEGELRKIILASPLLVTLDVTGCPQLSQQTIESLTAMYCPFLEALYF